MVRKFYQFKRDLSTLLKIIKALTTLKF
jgi:hypothetical protein